MSKCTKRNHSFLCHLRRATPLKRSTLVNAASPDQIRSISEIAANFLKGNLKVNPGVVKKLYPYKNQVRLLAKKSISCKKKKSVLCQSGGFLPLLIAPFLSAIGAFAGKALAKAVGI